ncbi:sensor histidine kinase [Desnuesiella massiliensis]|uniref:sensor histidine kinase n=1 Tax=Desnuesiella massiliensis TaxID=1650662 RepID=UPI0006E3A5AD|nr:HAMP domain-containing sensor histidine kinase [Desnuesiella massiliensis]
MENSKLKIKSIKIRIVSNFILVIFISIFILEILLISFMRQYYYNNIGEMLSNQIKTSSDFYTRYFSNTTLEENILDNVDVFWKQTNAQVQIIDLNGKILMDSIGVIPKEHLDSSDFKKALKGEVGKWIGKIEYDKHNVIAVSYPLKSDNKIIGIIRFVSSLKEVNKSIISISLIFISIGLIVLTLSILLILVFANSIINPIKEVTKVAEKMAAGDLRVRSVKKHSDEIGRLSDTLNYMAEEIIKKDQLKNEFISSISHELRTPLTSIKGWAITLNYDGIDKKTLNDGLEIIHKETDRLTYMVEELLDFSKFVSGKINLEKEKVNINSLIEYTQKYIKPRAERENICFNIENKAGDIEIYLDVNRIKQALINVLDNAFKFTASGGEVKFHIYIQDKYLVMVIKDTGCGIPEEDLPKVKEKFYKGKSSKSKNGIGLSITDEIVKLHEGILEINSKLNEGTEVYLKLPLSNP